jgi:hypothetical protein
MRGLTLGMTVDVGDWLASLPPWASKAPGRDVVEVAELATQKGEQIIVT